MKIITQTGRLYLREFVPEDGKHFYEMNSDPEVVKYTGDGPFARTEQAFDFVKNYAQYEKYGMGRWAVIRKSDGTFLGWCGLKYHPEDDLVEVGYRLYQQFWGRGYATEAAKASIAYGFESLKLERIYAHVHIDNASSHKVAEKSGLNFVKEFQYDGIPAKLYCIEKEHFYNTK